MAASSAGSVVKCFRGILNELRTIHGNGYRNVPAYSFLLDQYKRHKVTDLKICKGQDDMRYDAETYCTYLLSTKEYLRIKKEYTGKGELSVEEAGRLVGLAMPIIKK